MNPVTLPTISDGLPSSSAFLVFRPATDASAAFSMAALISGVIQVDGVFFWTVMHPLSLVRPPYGHKKNRRGGLS